ncbi:MAG: hypothetical protein WDN46_19700 [Methylocella sp.]
MKRLRLLALGAAVAVGGHAASGEPLFSSTPSLIQSGSRDAPTAQEAGKATAPVLGRYGSETISRQVIDEQHATTICGALRNVSGVTCR